jgi:hypothetical protein
MRSLVPAIASLLCWLTLPSLACPGSSEGDAAKTLKAYYAGQKNIDYHAALKKLATAGSAESEQMAGWLRALLAQSVKDEKSGEAPWAATPFFGGGGQNPARELRKWIAIELGKSEPLPAALPVLRWFFDEETMPAFQLDAATALAKLKGKEAAALRAQLATRPHSNLLVVLTALKQIGAAKETLPADKLQSLCHHHRLAIRDAARELYQQQSGADPGPFDPVKAMRSAGIGNLMKKLDGLFIDMPPAAAPFIAVTPNNPVRVGRGTTTIKGWLIKEDADKVEFFSQFGRKESFSTADCKVARPKIEEEVAAIEMIRKDGDKGFQFSESGALSGQFRGRGASLIELMLAQRLFAAGKLDLASRVLFPALETIYRDEEAADVARHELGRVYGYEMLAAFAGDRDYQRTAKFASTLAKNYPDTMFHQYAVGLTTQMPKRGDDFVNLKLPTPAEWEGLKKKLTRAQQIDFLCERIRLLNCFQQGQPAGMELSQKQFAEPGGISRNASWGGTRGKTEVINPLLELRGPFGWFQGKLSSSDDLAGRSKGMSLTLKDVPQLSNYLWDDWFIPTVTFWRDFHPARELHSTRPIFAHIINKLAGKDLCEIDRWRKLQPAQIDMEIERIARWAKENAEKTPLELEWIGLEELLAKGATWLKVKDRVEGLVKQKQPKALDVMKRFLQDEKTDAWDKWRILEVYRKQIDLEWVAKDLEHQSDAVRICAAVVVFRSDKSAKAREILGDALEKRGLEWWTQTAVEALLSEGSPEARRQVARLFAYKNMHLQKTLLITPVFRGNIMLKCADAGMVEPYQYYLKQLDNNELVPLGPGISERDKLTWAELHVAEIWREFGSANATVNEITSKFRTNAERLPAMKKWLQGRIAELGGTEKQTSKCAQGK